MKITIEVINDRVSVRNQNQLLLFDTQLSEGDFDFFFMLIRIIWKELFSRHYKGVS